MSSRPCKFECGMQLTWDNAKRKFVEPDQQEHTRERCESLKTRQPVSGRPSPEQPVDLQALVVAIRDLTLAIKGVKEMKPSSQPKPRATVKALTKKALAMTSKEPMRATVELEFDDPVVLEIYETLAKLRGETIGQLAGKAMQQALGPVKDRQSSEGAFEEWVAEKLEGKDELTAVSI